MRERERDREREREREREEREREKREREGERERLYMKYELIALHQWYKYADLGFLLICHESVT